MTGTEQSSVLGGRRKEKVHSERVAVERSKPVRRPLGMTDHRESNNERVDGTSRVDVTSRLIRGGDMFHGCRQVGWSQQGSEAQYR